MMTKERMKALLDQIVEHESVARTTKEQIQHLLYIGFTAEELYQDFGYSEKDVEEAEEDILDTVKTTA